MQLKRLLAFCINNYYCDFSLDFDDSAFNDVCEKATSSQSSSGSSTSDGCFETELKRADCLPVTDESDLTVASKWKRKKKD